MTKEINGYKIKPYANFDTRTIAEMWYDEKLAEGKKPQLWKVETTTTFEAMRPQQLEDN